MCENIHCEICKKLKNMLNIFIKISCSHTNIHIDICICHRYTYYVIRKYKIEFVRQHDMQCCSECTRTI